MGIFPNRLAIAHHFNCSSLPLLRRCNKQRETQGKLLYELLKIPDFTAQERETN
jgi:hypothetical protein